jgi:hypothetical protein
MAQGSVFIIPLSDLVCFLVFDGVGFAFMTPLCDSFFF